MRGVSADIVRTVFLLSMMCIVAIVWLPAPGFATGQTSAPTVSTPHLVAWQMQPITKYDNADILVDVTSSAPIVNVTLYYCLRFPSPPNQTCPDQFHNTRQMYEIQGNATWGIYEATMPRILLDSVTIWGEARAVDANHQAA